MSKYIKFELFEKKKKTRVYSVKQHDTLFILGFIKWFAAWRKYCFYPEDGIIFDTSCLQAIIDFIKKLMDERREVRKLIKAKKKFFDTGDSHS